MVSHPVINRYLRAKDQNFLVGAFVLPPEDDPDEDPEEEEPEEVLVLAALPDELLLLLPEEFELPELPKVSRRKLPAFEPLPR